MLSFSMFFLNRLLFRVFYCKSHRTLKCPSMVQIKDQEVSHCSYFTTLKVIEGMSSHLGALVLSIVISNLDYGHMLRLIANLFTLQNNLKPS